MFKRTIIFAFVLLAMPAVNANPFSVRAKSLPNFNVLCYRIMDTTFIEGDADQIVEGYSGGKARYNLYTVDGQVLKVVTNPEEPGIRKEYGKFASEVFISPITDPTKRPPIFSWKDLSNIRTESFSYRSDERILSVVRLDKPNRLMRASSTNEVLKCRDK